MTGGGDDYGFTWDRIDTPIKFIEALYRLSVRPGFTAETCHGLCREFAMKYCSNGEFKGT